jgi:drug/metabolite transporter (DMT)-like permease
MGNLVLFLCVLLWGVSTFLNRISVERLPPYLMQVIVGLVFVLYMPIAFRLQGINPLDYKWPISSVALTVVATFISIIANLLFYSTLKGSSHTGASTMIISLYPIVTLVLSYFFLNEQFTPLKITGVIAMIGGAILLSLK